MDPNHKSKVGQNTSIIRGVPEPAKYKNEDDKTAKMEAKIATLFLNQRLSNKMSNTPSSTPIIMLGSLML